MVCKSSKVYTTWCLYEYLMDGMEVRETRSVYLYEAGPSWQLSRVSTDVLD